MNVARLVGTLAAVLALYTVITAPQDAASMTRAGVAGLGVAGDSAAEFVMALFSGPDRTVMPAGGVSTGDGSSAG